MYSCLRTFVVDWPASKIICIDIYFDLLAILDDMVNIHGDCSKFIEYKFIKIFISNFRKFLIRLKMAIH